jgi:hypothetical protein
MPNCSPVSTSVYPTSRYHAYVCIPEEGVLWTGAWDKLAVSGLDMVLG